jgi:hypothetical protein
MLGKRSLSFVNMVILALLAVLTLTGVYGLFWTLERWAFDLHRLAGWALFAILPWKVAISWRSLRRGLRPGFDRGVMVVVSLLLAALSLAVLAMGLGWQWRLGPQDLWLRQTAISWHWMLALGLLLPLALHAWRRWPRPRRSDFLTRRATLLLLGLGAAALFAWWSGEALAGWRAAEKARRRFSGSRLEGLYSGNAFPVTHSVAAEPVEAGEWQLVVEGAVRRRLALSYEDITGLPGEEKEATLDCTLGWFTVQCWQGISLKELLAAAGAEPRSFAVKFESVTGYAHILPLTEASQVLLATHVGGDILDHVHGFPLRAVVPTRRGWFWVKWLARIEVISI